MWPHGAKAGANTEHGYAGIEDKVVKEIADFVKDIDHHKKLSGARVVGAGARPNWKEQSP